MHMFFIVYVECNNFLLDREGNKPARIIKHDNINQLIIRLFQIWKKCFNKWFPL